VIRSGQSTLVQIADPYIGSDVASARGDQPDLDPEEQAEQHRAAALDAWVDRLTRLSGMDGWELASARCAEQEQRSRSPMPSRLALQAEALLRRVAAWEARAAADSGTFEPLVSARLAKLSGEECEDETKLLDLLRLAYRQLMRKIGMTDGFIDSFISSYDTNSLISEVSANLPASLEENRNVSNLP
jgi:hypothetical protein